MKGSETDNGAAAKNPDIGIFDFTSTYQSIFNDDDGAKSITDEDMSNQLLNTYDISTKLVLAPPNKQFMSSMMGDVDKLFACPSTAVNILPNTKLLKNYQRNLKTSSVGSTYGYILWLNIESQDNLGLNEHPKIKILHVLLILQLHIILMKIRSKFRPINGQQH